MNFRLPKVIKQRIERAAAVSGLTTTDFAVNILTISADKVLSEQEVRRLSDRDRDLFIRMLDSTARPNRALRQAASRYKKLVGE